MPMEYFIEELTSKGKLFHGSVFSRSEALREIDRIRNKTKTRNPLSYRAEFVPINQIEDADDRIIEIIAEDIYKEVYGSDADLSQACESDRRFFEIVARTANEIVAKHNLCLLNSERRSN